MTACAYAACTRAGVTVADGWAFCAHHHQAHTELAYEDQHRAALDGHVSGRLLPSLNLTALLEVLGRYERERGPTRRRCRMTLRAPTGVVEGEAAAPVGHARRQEHPQRSDGDKMTTSSGTELTEGTRGLVSRLAAIAEEKATLEAEERTIKAELRASLDIGQWTWNGTPVLSVAPNRRFSPEKAAQILPPDLLALCRSDKVDSSTAKKVLPPVLYAQCQDIAGEPVIRIL